MVTRSTIHKPSKVDRARERLADAVERLEVALSASSSTSSTSSLGQGVVESDDGSAKISELMADLQDLQVENGRLRDQKKQVSERLGATINRFKQAIGD